MAIARRSDLLPAPSFFSRLRTLASHLQRWKHTSPAGSESTPVTGAEEWNSPLKEGSFNPSTWKTVDSRTLGIRRSAISSSAWTVLQILKRKGYEAYLVGGCVRDLLLRRTPKDFDIITTASLKKVKKHFHRCFTVGRRFPICHVHVLGSVVEVSSFNTIPENVKERRATFFPQMSNSCDEKDLIRWKNCVERDFTINGLFFDPFGCTIYDYVDGIKDIRTSKLRTVIPAHLSFKEDCARILRGLRIVARLGLRFSKETAAAIREFSSSIMALDKSRLMMELNFMLAYGAAESSIHLLQKYGLLEILLPVHAAYLADQAKNRPGENSVMLMKLLSNVDELLAADRPCDCTLWLALLAFHLALVEHPQDALVVRTFACILYRGTWNKAAEYARQSTKDYVQFAPEILVHSEAKADELLLEEASHLASLVKSSVDALTNIDAVQELLARYPEPSPHFGLVFVSEKMGKMVAKLFDVLETDIRSYDKKRETCDINFELLKKGDPDETRFVLGKIIVGTMDVELTDVDCQNVSLTKKSHPKLSVLFK